MSGGWYKQQRNIPERPWFKDADVVQLYTFLKATAYVADGRYEGCIIRRGSCPTTRAEMMEATGLSYKQVHRCLNILISNNEIIVSGNNRYSVITICDYESCGTENSLFDMSEEQPRNNRGTTGGTAEDTTPYISKKKKEERSNLVSLTSYKQERENSIDALEIKKRYNKEFEGILPPCVRLSTAVRLSVAECLRRFGLQSVDMVFAQIKSEQFSLGNNKTGFIANFTFIFTPRNYQHYLERAQLGRQKKASPAKVGTLNTDDADAAPGRQSRYDFLMQWVEACRTSPSARATDILTACYESGELSQLGIDWKPNNNE